MVYLELPEPNFSNLFLEPENRNVRGGKPTPPEVANERLEGWLSLGEPVWVLLKPSSIQDDHELQQFIEQQSLEFEFYLVLLACSFSPSDDEPFVKAWLEVQLHRADGTEGSHPIAWSMKPKRSTTAIEFSNKLEVGGSLKFPLADVSTKGEEGKTWSREYIFIDALNELHDRPIWQFSKTPLQELRGSHRLAMIVRSPIESGASASVGLSATIQRKRFGLIAYNAAFPEGKRKSFRFG